MMSRIAAEAEMADRKHDFHQLDLDDTSEPEIVAQSAVSAANAWNARAIVVFSMRGTTGRMVSRHRPPVPIYVFTPSESTARFMSLVYGVVPLIAPDVKETDAMIAQMEEFLIQRGLVYPGDRVVLTSGQPIGQPGTTNLLKLHTISRTA